MFTCFDPATIPRMWKGERIFRKHRIQRQRTQRVHPWKGKHQRRINRICSFHPINIWYVRWFSTFPSQPIVFEPIHVCTIHTIHTWPSPYWHHPVSVMWWVLISRDRGILAETEAWERVRITGRTQLTHRAFFIKTFPLDVATSNPPTQNVLLSCRCYAPSLRSRHELRINNKHF